MDGVSTSVEARHRALLDALPDLLLRLGADGTYLELGGDLSRLANPPELVVGLHDGAQQRLVAVSLYLHLIRKRLEARPDAVPELLDAAQNELALALEEIRELVRGLHPRIPTDHGLARAVHTVAERSLLPVEIISLPEGRLGSSVEAAALYVIAEAVANAAKHAQEGQITIRVEALATHTVVEVKNDGIGGADPTGSGLQGLADRVAALGGSFALSSVPGAGTAVRAELPRATNGPGQ